MKDIASRLLNNHRNDLERDNLNEIILYEVFYKICLDFKNEKDYLREPHALLSYLESINLEELKKEPLFRNLLNQLKPFDIVSGQIATDFNIEADLTSLNELDFTKDIIRGNYWDLYQRFIALQKILFENDSRKKSEYLTPESITVLLKKILCVKKGETLMDPCFGSGDMALTIGEKADLIQGQEINQTSYGLGKMNSILSNKKCSLKLGDSLTALERAPADVVVSNSPFAMRLNQNLEYDYLKWGKPSKSGGDFYFISLLLDRMKNRGAIVVPEGVLFRAGKDGEVRANILKENFIDAIIALPAKLFSTTGITTSLIIFNKKKTDTNVLFIDAKDFYEKVRGGVEITKEKLERIIEIYKNKETKEGVSVNIPLETVALNDYVLTVNRYVQKVSKYDNIDLKELTKNVYLLESEIVLLRDKTNSLLKAVSK